MPRCSIIVPVYNQPRATENCINTLLQQHRGDADLEIIVVDDGSNQPTRDLLERFGAQVRIVAHPANTGFATACNDGAAAAAAAGHLLVFLNNDTIPQPG